MDYRLELNAKAILEKKFAKNVKGYDASEVDEFLDCVIRDYQKFALYHRDMEAHAQALEEKLASIRSGNEENEKNRQKTLERLKELELENASLHNKLDGIKPGDNPTVENLEYIQRINALEDYLYRIGVDPRTIKAK